MKGLKLVGICGFCGKVNKYMKITQYNPQTKKNWIFLEEFKGEKVNVWFCSEKCKSKQIKQWK